MTDRISHLTVVLADDVRDDECAPLIVAIGQLRGVLSVHHGEPVDPADFVARMRVDQEWRQKLVDMAYPSHARSAKA